MSRKRKFLLHADVNGGQSSANERIELHVQGLDDAVKVVDDVFDVAHLQLLPLHLAPISVAYR